MTNKREPRSPYARRQKKPYRYSDAYHAWAAAVDNHGHTSDEAEAADVAFRRKHGIPLNRFGRVEFGESAA